MKRWMLLASIFILLFASRIALAQPSLEQELQERHCPKVNCFINTAKMKSMLGKKIVYEINLRWGYSARDPSACPAVTQLVATGEWDPETGKAHEQFTRVGSAEVIWETTWSCSDDPWLKNVQCQFSGGYSWKRASLPRSAGPLTAAQRQSLSKEVFAAKMHSQKKVGPAAAASGSVAAPLPEILSPKDGTSVALRTTLALRVSHTPDRTPACVVLWGDPFQGKKQTVTMAYDKKTGISSGHFTVNESGDWIVRCSLMSPSGNKPQRGLHDVRIKVYDSSNQAPPDQNKLPSRPPARPGQR